ncbi:Spermidine/putrescine-binding periplasmic protein [Pseudomonas orientalis]|nr:Spermidine/putrescine-binding periplasmic protein [Pseudomonas orientalis]
MLRPSVIAASSNYLGYANANKDAKGLVDAKMRDNPGVRVR